jgi:predicted  nucleic acid-binding Zn-ribbon protein
MEREQELLNSLARLSDSFNGIGLDDIDNRSLRDVNDLITRLETIRERATALYDEMRNFESQGEYNVDEVQDFYRQYFAFENALERGFTTLGRRQAYIREQMTNLVREYREAQVEVVRINSDIEERENELIDTRGRIQTVSRQLDYLNRLYRNTLENNARADANGRELSERDARYQRESLERQVNELNTELGILNARVPELEREIAGLRSRLAETEQRVSTLGQDVEDYRAGRKVVPPFVGRTTEPTTPTTTPTGPTGGSDGPSAGTNPGTTPEEDPNVGRDDDIPEEPVEGQTNEATEDVELYTDYVPERAIFESRGMTQEEYIAWWFEQRTKRKFDPAIHEIRYNNDAYSDGYDSPVSTYTIVEKKREQEVEYEEVEEEIIEEVPVFDDYVPERPIFESRGMTQEEYIAWWFEQQTKIKFDPAIHEIRYNNDAYDDGYDNPISTYTIIEKRKQIVKKRVPKKPDPQKPDPQEPEPIEEKHPTGDMLNHYNVQFDFSGGELFGYGGFGSLVYEGTCIQDYEDLLKVYNGTPVLDADHEFIGWEPSIPGFDQTTPIQGDVVLKAKYRAKIIDIDKEYGDIDDLTDADIKDMLDKFWGNEEKHKKFIAAIARVHAHIVEKDGHMTIEDYDGLKEDLYFCRIEEYKERLERFTTPNDEAYIKLYNDLLEFDPESIPEKEDGTKITLEEFVAITKYDDELYLSTNNQNYDKHKSTAEHIKTHGKHGEKQAYQNLESVSGLEGAEKAKAIAANAAKAANNVYLFIRNHTKVPIHKFVGTYIASPIHKVLMSSKYSSPYRDDRTHRYGERKALYEALFEQEFEKKWQEKVAKRVAEGKKVRRPSLVVKGFKKAFGPRFKAMFNCKEGNIMVLASKANENKELGEALLAKKAEYREAYAKAARSKNRFENEINEINTKLDGDISLQEKHDLEAKRDELVKNIQDCERAMEFYSRTLGRTQNDSISMETHDKTNKENITKVVTGVELIGKALLLKWIIPKILAKRTLYRPEDVVIPGRTEYKEVEGITEEGLRNLKVQDIYDLTNGNDVLHYDAYEIHNITEPMVSNPLLRGFKSTYKGHNYSIGDIDKVLNGYPMTTSGNYPMPNDVGLFEAIAITINKGGGPKVTAEQLIKEIMSSPDPEQAFIDLISGTSLWTSDVSTGIAKGWLYMAEIAPKLAKMKHLVPIEIPGEVITKMIPYVEVYIKPGWLFAAGLVATSALGDIYDLARRTRSETEVQKELLRNAKSNIEKEIDKYDSEEEKAIARAALEFSLEQEAKKIVATFTKPGRNYNKAKFKNGYKFTGKRKDQKRSSYNEAEWEEVPEEGRGR